MKRTSTLFLVSITISVLVLVLSSAFQTQPAKVTGTWNMSVETTAGSGTPVLTLKQENDTLITGKYAGQFGEIPVKGTIKTNKIIIKFSSNDIDFEYSGTVDGNTMKGKVVIVGYGEGTFTGTRIVN
jgi:hypothetical protein